MYPVMPTGWKSQKTIRLTYNHESCPNVTFALICVPMGTLLVVHGKLESWVNDGMLVVNMLIAQ